ncbi:MULTISPECIES: hypothetical protein [unclassified Micromonospora]|uniref:hypothetical protein n=1 Tax=unclassified Micromonospora TaxID=2617518 RepID=UPI003316DB50
MFASATSVTFGSTSREIRRPITVDTGDGQRTIRVRPGRSNARREAINTSLGFRR